MHKLRYFKWNYHRVVDTRKQQVDRHPVDYASHEENRPVIYRYVVIVII